MAVRLVCLVSRCLKWCDKNHDVAHTRATKQTTWHAYLDCVQKEIIMALAKLLFHLSMHVPKQGASILSMTKDDSSSDDSSEDEDDDGDDGKGKKKDKGGKGKKGGKKGGNNGKKKKTKRTKKLTPEEQAKQDKLKEEKEKKAEENKEKQKALRIANKDHGHSCIHVEWMVLLTDQQTYCCHKFDL